MLNQEEKNLILRGEWIEAIKTVRRRLSLDLGTAKKLVDSFRFGEEMTDLDFERIKQVQEAKNALFAAFRKCHDAGMTNREILKMFGDELL